MIILYQGRRRSHCSGAHLPLIAGAHAAADHEHRQQQQQPEEREQQQQQRQQQQQHQRGHHSLVKRVHQRGHGHREWSGQRTVHRR